MAFIIRMNAKNFIACRLSLIRYDSYLLSNNTVNQRRFTHIRTALNGDNVDIVTDELKKILQPGPKYFPDDMITDQPERLLVSEIVREKLLRATREEVPHAVAVFTEEMAKRDNDKVYIRVTVYVERESQKRIVIGKNGAVLKEIGRYARTEIEQLLGSNVFLDIWVKVKPDWRNKAAALNEFGYKDE